MMVVVVNGMIYYDASLTPIKKCHQFPETLNYPYHVHKASESPPQGRELLTRTVHHSMKPRVLLEKLPNTRGKSKASSVERLSSHQSTYKDLEETTG